MPHYCRQPLFAPSDNLRTRVAKLYRANDESDGPSRPIPRLFKNYVEQHGRPPFDKHTPLPLREEARGCNTPRSQFRWDPSMGIKVLWDEVYRIAPPEPDTLQPPTGIEGLPEFLIPPPPPLTPTPIYFAPQLSPELVGPQPAEQRYHAQPAPTENEFPSGNPAPGAQIKQSNDTQVNITASQTVEFEVQDENPLDRCIGMVSEWRAKVARDGIIGAVGAPTASTIARM